MAQYQWMESAWSSGSWLNTVPALPPECAAGQEEVPWFGPENLVFVYMKIRVAVYGYI